MHAFHPAVAAWFGRAFAAPTAAQELAWPAIRSGRDTLIAAPTGSGKTLAAFLAAIDALVRRSGGGPLPDETAVVYVSPLKALSNDIRLNLEAPIEGIRAELKRLNLPDVEIRPFVRTGDTPQAERTLMKKRAPHIVVTTPESLYILLGSESGRKILATTRTVIVDEIHAIAASKRGSHLALSLERLDVLAGRRLTRIGLSATQKPIEEVARFLVGAAPDGTGLDCTIIDTGHARARDLGVVLPPSPLEAVMSNEVKQEVYEQLTVLIRAHRTTLIFVNTRRMAERAARHLGERLGKEAVAAHHGSLSREHRLDAEQRLKHGQLQVLIATASLELGIDIGDVDLVCQLGSPRSIAAFLQRAGRSGHAVGATPKGRLFPQSRDDLVECAALLDCVRRGELDALVVPDKPLDVLAQQIVAEVACQDWKEDALFAMIRQAWPYRAITRVEFSAVVSMLADGYVTRVGTRGAYLHRDAVNGMLRARRGARLTAITSGGTIPDNAGYEVILEPQALRVGSVNEDFAIESLAGDIFQLGNVSYRILRVERGRVRVEDAKGVPPNIPFWLGEAAGRSDELSFAVSRLRAEIARKLESSPESALRWLCEDVGLIAPAAAWESEILPARFKAYDFTWLDDLCLSGRVVWTRLSPPATSGQREHAGGPVRTTPIALLQRRNIGLWTALGKNDHADALPLSSRARALFEYLTRHGASFFDELLAGTRLLRSQLEEALGELVAVGLVTSDSFMGLRALLLPSDERNTNARRARRGRRGLLGIDDAGRWSLTRRAVVAPGESNEPEPTANARTLKAKSSASNAKPATSPADPRAETRASNFKPASPASNPKPPPETIEHIAWTLLKRYGVVCWRMLEREAAWLPPWRDLLRVYHRLEARGEIRGGRFVAGLSGEQFALPDAVGLLRKVRKQSTDGALVSICGADPLNLLGSAIPGAKVPALTGARILFRDGVPIATLIAREVSFREKLGPGQEWAMKKLLLRDHLSLVGRNIEDAQESAIGPEERA